MNRKDMQKGVLYAIRVDGYNTRPGYVLDAGKPPNKVKVRVYWTWANQEDDYLNPTPPLLDEFAKYDDKFALTSGIDGLWSDYCSKVKAERKAALNKKLAEEAAEEAVRQTGIARVEVIAPILEAHGLLATLRDLRYTAKNDRMSQREFSARDVLDLIEILAPAIEIESWDTMPEVPHTTHVREIEALEANGANRTPAQEQRLAFLKGLTDTPVSTLQAWGQS